MAGLEINGRALGIPMLFFIAAFALANFIDALKAPEGTTEYWLLIRLGQAFLIGMGLLEGLQIAQAVRRIRGGRGSGTKNSGRSRHPYLGQ